MDKLIIVGAGNFGQIAYEYFTHSQQYEVVAFSVEAPFHTDLALADVRPTGWPVYPFETLEKSCPPEYFYHVYVAVLYQNLNRERTRLYQAAKEKGYMMASYFSPWAWKWDNVEIGEHCFIFEHNRIQPFCKVGDNVIMWSGNHIGHHSTIGNNVFISSEVVVSGNCEIGDNTFIGVNAAIANGVKIGKDCIIQAGAVVGRDVPDNCVVKTVKGKISKVAALDYRLA